MRHPGINSYALLLLVSPHRTQHNVENVRLTNVSSLRRRQSSSSPSSSLNDGRLGNIFNFNFSVDLDFAHAGVYGSSILGYESPIV